MALTHGRPNSDHRGTEDAESFFGLCVLGATVVTILGSTRSKACLCLGLLLMLALVPARAVPAQADMSAEHSDIVLVIDHSGSMAENDPHFLRLAAAKLFVDLADDGDSLGIVVMSGAAETRQLVSSAGGVRQTDRIKQQIDNLRHEPMGQETHMGTALTLAYDMLEARTGNANARQFVVLLSDGLPTGDNQNELVAQAMMRFNERRYWKVFSIALAFKDASGPAYLQHAIAAPTGAEVLLAQHADELIDKYLELYARVGDDRFVDRLSVLPNTLAPLIAAHQSQLLTQLTIVLLRAGSRGSVRTLNAPGDHDLVNPFYQNTAYRADEPEYELFKVPLGGQVPLAGAWQINIAQPADAPANVVVLSRSQLRPRLPYPLAGVNDQDDQGLRYYPRGRPVLLIVGAETRGGGVQRPGRNNLDSWQRDMQPAVRALDPVVGPWISLTDNGRSYDLAARDGLYTGLLPSFDAVGDYRLEVEVPASREQAVHLRRSYRVRVADLPTMTLTLPPAATTLQLNTAFAGQIDLPGTAEFRIERVGFPLAFIERPDGVLDPLRMRPAAEGRWEWSYTPNFSGPYRVSVVAEVQGHGPMGPIRYVDYTEAPAAVPAAVPLISIQPGFEEPIAYGRDGVLSVPLVAYSRSPRREQLTIALRGLPGATVVPGSLVVEPFEPLRRTLSVRLPDGARPEQGRLTLAFTEPGQRVLLQGSEIGVPFVAKAAIDWLLLAVGAALAILAAGAFVVRRRRRRERRSTGPMTLRRVG